MFSKMKMEHSTIHTFKWEILREFGQLVIYQENAEVTDAMLKPRTAALSAT